MVIMCEIKIIIIIIAMQYAFPLPFRAVQFILWIHRSLCTTTSVNNAKNPPFLPAICLSGCASTAFCATPGVCRCRYGYAGVRCDRKLRRGRKCRHACLHGGVCRHGRCRCTRRHAGNACQHRGEKSTGSHQIFSCRNRFQTKRITF